MDIGQVFFYLGTAGPKTTFEIAQEFGCDLFTARIALAHLDEAGLVVTDGELWKINEDWIRERTLSPPSKQDIL